MESGETTLLVAFTLGLFSTLHCVGMCGGIIGSLSASLPPVVQHNKWLLLTYLLAYNSGRILSYIAAGVVMGVLGATMLFTLSPEFGHWALRWLSAIIVLLIGLYLGGWFNKLKTIERMGRPLWRAIEPLGRRLLPVDSIWQAFLFGAIWGWLPCGLVYVVLLWSVSAGGAGEAAWLMLAFGIGTLPTVLTTGILSAKFIEIIRRLSVRRMAGGIIIVVALVSLIYNHNHDEHKHNNNQHSHQQNNADG